MFGPFGLPAGLHTTDMILWDMGVAMGAATSAGGAGLVRTTVAGLSVQPPSVTEINIHYILQMNSKRSRYTVCHKKCLFVFDNNYNFCTAVVTPELTRRDGCVPREGLLDKISAKI